MVLAEQQYSVLSKQLPLYQSRLLLGSDNIDHWSTQRIWDKILLNIRIVVSTPQVLLNAMSSGFVKLSKLALLVFDEGIFLIWPLENSVADQIIQHTGVSRLVLSMASCVYITAHGWPATMWNYRGSWA